MNRQAPKPLSIWMTYLGCTYCNETCIKSVFVFLGIGNTASNDHVNNVTVTVSLLPIIPAPFIAILTVSWLGKWSDLIGRRKPFILALCLLLIASLLLLIGVQNLLAVQGTNAFG